MLPYAKPADGAAAGVARVVGPATSTRDATSSGGGGGGDVIMSQAARMGRKLQLRATEHELRVWDYFALPQPAAGAAEASAAHSAAATASGALPAGCVAVECADGVVRGLPAVLVEVMCRARDEGYAPPDGPGVVGDVPPSSLALAALGGLVWTLRRALLDLQVMSLRRVAYYRHADGVDGGAATTAAERSGAAAAAPRGEGDGGAAHLVLDSASLVNLDVLENSDTGGRAGSLLGALDRTVTPMGKRRFRQWLAGPLLRPEDIEDR